MPEMDYSRLLIKMKENRITQSGIAELIDCSSNTVWLKLHSRVPWKQKEIDIIATALDIPVSEIGFYFFQRKLEKSQVGG